MAPVMPCRNHFRQQRASVDLNLMVAIIASMLQRCLCSSGMFCLLFSLFSRYTSLAIFLKDISGFLAYLNSERSLIKSTIKAVWKEKKKTSSKNSSHALCLGNDAAQVINRLINFTRQHMFVKEVTWDDAWKDLTCLQSKGSLYLLTSLEIKNVWFWCLCASCQRYEIKTSENRTNE